MMAVCQRMLDFGREDGYCVQNTWGKQALNCHIQKNNPGTTAGTNCRTTHYIPTKSQNSRNYLHSDPGVTGSWQKLAKLEGGKRSARLNLSASKWWGTCAYSRSFQKVGRDNLLSNKSVHLGHACLKHKNPHPMDSQLLDWLVELHHLRDRKKWSPNKAVFIGFNQSQ